MYKSFKASKKIIVTILFVLLFSFFTPPFIKQVSAQLFVPVFDPINFSANAVTATNEVGATMKEYGLDYVAGQMLNLVMQRMIQSTTNWINSGFRGKPAFITNPQAFFQNVGDQLAGQYIFRNPNLNFLCGPLRAKIKITLANNYTGNVRDRWQCTLSQAGRNLDNFMADFNNGGWENFFEVTQRPQNNPIGAYIQAEDELLARIAKKTEEKNKELSQGRGFLSYKKCKRYATKTNQAPQGADDNGNTDSANSAKELEDNFFRDFPGSDDAAMTDDNGNPLTEAQSQNLRCLEEETLTPGDVISNQINQKLNFAGQKLVNSDEINEMISALLNQVVTKVVGTIGSGLGSLSKPDPSTGKSFTSQLSNEKTVEEVNKYFAESATKADTLLNLPPYDAMYCRNNPTAPDCAPPADPNAGNQNNCDPDTDPNCQTPSP